MRNPDPMGIYRLLRLALIAFLCSTLPVACTDDGSQNEADGGDTETTDTGTETTDDSATVDTDTEDTETVDTGTVDTGTVDTETETETEDTETEDTDTGADDITVIEVGYSLFVVCLGVDHDYSEEFGEGHDIIVSPTWDQSALFDLIRDGQIEEMGYAILNYTAVDPKNAPEGKNAICISAMLMYDWEDEYHWAEGYDTYQEFKTDLGMILVERAEQDALPFLTQHIEVMEVMTPQTLKGFSSNPKGSIFGWHMTPEQSLDNRLPAQTPIDNLLLSSAWTFPGGGQSAVLNSGYYAKTAVLAKEYGPDNSPIVIPENWIAGMSVDTFQRIGIYDKVTPVRLDPMYRARYTDTEDGKPKDFDIPANEAEYKEMLKAEFPAESDGIDKLWKRMKRIDEVMRIIFYYQKEGKEIMIGGKDSMAFMQKMTELGMLQDLLAVQKLMTETTLTQFLEGFIQDVELITVFTQLSGFAGTGPDDVSAMFFIAMWTSYHLGGYYYFEGGSQAVSDAMAEVIVENDGVVRLNTRAKKIVIGDDNLANRVVTDDGICYNARYVISNASAPVTMLDMVGEEYLPTDPKDKYHPISLKWEDGGYDYPGAPLDAEPSADLQIDAITSATPGVETAILTAANHAAGYAKTNCMSCHEGKAHGNNQPGYSDGECTTCHGQNGSPNTPSQHALEGCATCHADAHTGRNYSGPTDCRGCHKFNVPTDDTCVAEESYDVVIIGSGGGGLSAGALLSQEGLSVLLVEQHHKVGGYMTNFNRGDYRFEISLHAFDGLAPEVLVY